MSFIRYLSESVLTRSLMFGAVAGDVTTTTGAEVLRWKTGLDPLATSLVKMKAAIWSNLAAVPVDDVWRLEYLGKLLKARGDAHYGEEDTNQLTVLIDSLCSS